MIGLNKILAKIPQLISGKVSIIIYLFLFFYLVVFALICVIFPFLKDFIPSSNIQLILGNYTNVLSALGASIAAGTGVAFHSKMKKMHENHKELQNSIDNLHKKIDELSLDNTVDDNQ